MKTNPISLGLPTDRPHFAALKRHVYLRTLLRALVRHGMDVCLRAERSPAIELLQDMADVIQAGASAYIEAHVAGSDLRLACQAYVIGALALVMLAHEEPAMRVETRRALLDLHAALGAA